MALTKVPSNLDSVTATTQSQGDGSTNVATTAYVDTGLANLIDSAPSNLNTLNELAAAMNDNASFFSTVLPLSGGTLTGDFAVGQSPPDLKVDRTNSRVGINCNPDYGFHAKVDKGIFHDPSGGQWLEINPDSNPVQIIASDQTGANYCGLKIRINNGGAYPVTAMDVKGHSGAHVAFGTDATTDSKMIISKNPSSATQTTPETILTVQTPVATTASDIKVGQGPQIVFKIPDDQAGNKSLGAAIAAQKQIDDDNDSTTRLTFFTTGNDETLDEAMTILGNGTIGIGTDTPSTTPKLEINGDGELLRLDGSGGGNRSIRFRGLSTSNPMLVTTDGSLKLHCEDSGTHMEFHTANTERMRIDGSGNVGIGQASPAAPLHIERAASETNLIVRSNIGGSGSSIGGRLRLQLGAQSNTGSGNADTQAGDTLGQIMFEGQGTDYSFQGGNIKCVVETGDGDDGRSNQGTYMSFETMNVGSVSPAEAMRITQSKVLAIGKSNDDSTSDGIWLRKHPTSGHGQIMCTGYGSSAYEGIYVRDTSNNEMEFMASYHGTIYYRNTSGFSDVRKKENIQNITLGLDAIKELRPVSFDWKNDKGKDQLGFIAQEVEDTSLKQIVTAYNDSHTNEDIKGLNKEALIPVLVKAVQELSAKLDAAEARITELEG